MTLPIDKIEEFFGAKFEPLQVSSEGIRELRCFDGYAHWCIWLDERKQFLHFRADKAEDFNSFPLLEISVYYSGICITPFDLGVLFVLRPKGEKHRKHLFGITKTPEGRLSVCTSLGENDDIGEPPRCWFEDDES